MLRIYVHDQVPMTSFVLEGKLVGLWVKELENCWKSALVVSPSRTMLVDLADVSFIDAEGRALLARMRQKGVRLLSTGVLINAIVDEINTEQRLHSKQRSSSNRNEKEASRESHDVNT
jgi:ABC-type transporter Mla MlaB component